MGYHLHPTMQPKVAARRVDIRGRMYLWLHRQAQYAPKLIISSHGSIPKRHSPTFIVPVGVTLYFYSAHGEETKASSLTSAVLNGQHKESITGDGIKTCYNYSLSKYQELGGETYEGIQELQDAKDEKEEDYWLARERGALSIELKGYVGGLKDFDVLTVRKRLWLPNAVTLEEVVKSVKQVHPYTQIHCSFCRAFE